MNRRQLISAAAGVGTVTALAAAARYGVLSPPPRRDGASIDELAAEIHASVSSSQGVRACFPYDHPLRQVHNRGVSLGGLTIDAATLSWNARRALTTILRERLSAPGFERLLSQVPSGFSGVNFLQLLLFGTPGRGPWQMLLSGIHLNLRVGSPIREGTAFGGPQVYGDQRGDHRAGLPGNLFRYQMQAAHELIAGLTPAQRGAIRVAQAPPQTCIAVQGRGGQFDGLAVGQLPLQSRRRAQALVGGILDNYGAAGAAYAWECLNRNGGVDGLHFADYDVDFEGGRHAGLTPSQIFRLEGPAAVFHFRGEPHVHAFACVEQNVDQPLSLGEVLGTNPAALGGESLRTWFQCAMVRQSAADFAVYPSYSVVGRLRAGTIRTGDIWAAENWVDDLILCEVRGADIAASLGDLMRSRGNSPRPHSTYRIATTGDVAANAAESRIGRIANSRNCGLLREALASQARLQGFRA
ncbi:MAG TPA: hypothetical protein VK700_16690 [Steroidobacteraceae bacterium]|jgi:hypothetical protein|nr:hypothetical protein [Steroidobacteraceae bacterium]